MSAAPTDLTREQTQTLDVLAERWTRVRLDTAQNGAVLARGMNPQTGRWESFLVLHTGGVTQGIGYGRSL
jgi:hypothetical protein